MCPNCHSQTDTYCSSSKAHGIYKTSYIKNGIEQKTNYCKVCNINIVPRNRKICLECIEIKNKREKIHYCKECNKNIVSRKNKTCVECAFIKRRKIIDRPTKEQLNTDLLTMSYTSVGKKYGVSDNAIRKWLKN